MEPTKQKDYRYLIVDASVILMKSFFVATKYNPSTFSQATLMKMFFYSIAKSVRELGTFEKVILFHDRWPYHKTSFLHDYKGDRSYASDDSLKGGEEYIEDLKKKLIVLSSNLTPTVLEVEEILTLEELIKTNIIYHENQKIQLVQNKVKNDAKYTIINKFGEFGIPSFLKKGFEADDLARIFSETYLPEDGKKSLLLTSDSDWMYLVTPHVDMHFIKRGITYTHEDMMEEISGFPGSLYEYKSLYDSLVGSHNNMQPTASEESLKYKSYCELVKKAKIEGVDSLLRPSYEYENESGKKFLIHPKELFEANMKSWDVHLFPEYEKVKSMMYYLDKAGSLAPGCDFNMWGLHNGMVISTDYYTNFIDTLNPKLYSSTPVTT